MANFCPSVEEICIARGDSPVISVRVTDDADVVVDITGFIFVLTVDISPEPIDNSNNVFSLSVGPVVDGTSGVVQFQPSIVDTDQSPKVYFYDVQMTTTTPSVRTLLRGNFQIDQDVSKV